MTREEYDRIAAMQDEYLRERDVVVIDGFIGNDPSFRTRARLAIEQANANIGDAAEALLPARRRRRGRWGAGGARDPARRTSRHPGYPDDRVIAVDLDQGVTRVLSDYFGESKKGGLGCGTRRCTTSAGSPSTPA